MKLLLTISMSVMLLCFGGNKVEWSEERPLTWKYFKGKPNLRSSHGAISNIGISYDFKELKNGEIQLDVITHFYKKDSWVKPGEDTETLLAHENLHFDIAEIYARKIRKTVKEDSNINTINIGKTFRQIYKEYKQQYDERQELYDAETNHSKNQEEQSRWIEMIRQELEELSAYKEVVINIPK